MKKFLLIVVMFAAVFALPTQADFFQCPPTCVAGDNADIINGSPADDTVLAGEGNDLILGGDGRDQITAEEGDDIIFGGSGSDNLDGGLDNDTIIPGPDEVQFIQFVFGREGNDSFIILASETVSCQFITGAEGFDTVNLIGFGPYSLDFPFGLPTPIEVDSSIIVQDPIAGGYIIMFITDQTSDSIERINGLVSPNVSVLGQTATNTFLQENCAGFI